MAIRFLANPLPASPVPCGGADDAALIRAWHADAPFDASRPATGTGLAAIEKADASLAPAAFTFECWLTWPRGVPPLRTPAVVAEAAGDRWSWRLSFDHAGALRFVRTEGDDFRLTAGDILVDSLLPGRWYHVAVTLDTAKQAVLYVTPAGEPVARQTGERRKLDFPADAAAAPGGAGQDASRRAARLAVGRAIDDAKPSPLHIASAALYGRVLRCGEFAALGPAPLPKGITVDGDMEFGSVGRAFALADGVIGYTAGRKDGSWMSFRVRGARGRTLTFVQLGGGGQGIFVSEDGGRSWGHPSGGAWRRAEGTALEFTHTFAADEALFATTPPATAAMADAWLDGAARRLGGRVTEIGRSRLGHPLRVLEVGNADAPLVFLEAGQHSMSERLGYFFITEMFTRAAADEELMRRTRWAILPVVNVDSYTVGPPDGNMNRFWGRAEGPTTIMALCRWLRAEADRTSVALMIDLHEGWCWRGHTLLGETTAGFSDPTGNWRSLNVKRESIYPEFEACLKAEGIDYAVLNGYARNRAKFGQNGYFEEFGKTLRGDPVPICLELSCIVAETSRGAEPVSIANLREDAAAWHRAARRYLLNRR